MEHVTKQYARRRVLDDVSLTLPRGTFALLIGPNGSGKTTLLRLLSTYMAPSSGTVHWVAADGGELRDPALVRARIGYTGHTPLVWDELTTRENVELQLRLRERGRAEADEWLRLLDLASRSDDRADTLSRGGRQRLALACAMAPRPDFLLLDEPASNLDEASVTKLLDVLATFRGRVTTVVATHEPQRFRPLADRVLRIHAGQVTEAEPAP